MNFKIGDKVTINTVENVIKKIKGTSVYDDINIDFFRRYGNKEAVVDEITENNYILLYAEGVERTRLRIPEKHFYFAFKNYTSIELDENLFQL